MLIINPEDPRMNLFHKIETSLEGIENLSKEKNEEIERKVKEESNYSN